MREAAWRHLINCVAAALLFSLVSVCASQDTVKPDPAMPFSEDLKKYPGLLTELAHLVEALKNNVQLPPVRTESPLLPHLPVTCKEFVAVGTPISSSTGTRSFCTTSDGFVRYKIGPPLTSTIRPYECRQWAPVQ